MVASIHAKLGYFILFEQCGGQKRGQIVSQNRFQNGVVFGYFPAYLRNLSEGLVDSLNFALMLSSFYAYHIILKENPRQLMTI